MIRTYRTLKQRWMKRNKEFGLFTKPSKVKDKNNQSRDREGVRDKRSEVKGSHGPPW